MSERRHFRVSPRPQLSCQVKVLRSDSPPTSQTISYTKDIGTGGLFLENDCDLAKGERVEVTLSTPATWEPLVLKAEVVWAETCGGDDPGGAGLQFIGMSKEEFLALSDFVNTLDYEG